MLELQLETDKLVTVNMGVPQLDPAQIPFQADQAATLYDIDVNGENHQIAAISMGNPHAVLQVADIDEAPVASLGPVLESHPSFPNQVNVGFMQIIDRNKIKLRVFERGVGETQACGSGACAAAVAAMRQELVDSPVTMQLTGGELRIQWQGDNEPLFMTGPAVSVFHGRVRI